MDKLLSLRAALIVVAFILAGFGIHNGFLALFSQGRFEVIYNYDETVRACFKSNCAYSGQLSIANTGKADQAGVAVEISGIPGGVRGRTSVLNLSATEPRSADPEIESSYHEDVARIDIKNFTPGTLVLVKFSGYYREEEDVRVPPSVAVTARGRVIEGDPRAITFGRYVTSNP